ncbi:hypothetical protein [Burkholderia territorii]|uniref:hypothetical protein n=1 Tax=Burkholderia territorii TaxID=1503055 RepID=UPI000A56D8E7|nr:hypothetical protein [Burkholderia territorii]
MQASQSPTLVPLAFAANGTKNTIPEASQIGITPGAASLNDGFPPLTFTPIAAGGVPPAGADFNGILNLITQSLRWQHAGGQYSYNSTFANDANVGGYPRGAVVMRADNSGMWINQTDNNTANPDTVGTGWVPAFMSGTVGQMRNLFMGLTVANVTGTLTADEIVVGSALAGQKYVLGGFNKTINLSTTGAGGMDTGSAPTSGYVAIYAIYNPTTGASALLATNATSSAAPNVYGGANMPSGYTASALVSVWPTDSSGRLTVGFQRDRSISITSQTAISTSSNAPSQTSLSISGIVPLNAKSISGVLHEASTATASCTATITPGLGSIGGQNIAGSLSAGQVSECNYSITLLTPQSVYYTTNVTAGTPTFIIYISAYTI